MNDAPESISGAMAPWPALAPLGRRVELGRRNGSAFLFDSGAPSDGGAGAPPLFFIHGLGDEADS